MPKNTLLLIVLLAACTKPPPKASSTLELQRLVKDFEYDFSVTVYYPVYFIDTFSDEITGPMQAAVCVYSTYTLGRYVEISSKYKGSLYLPNIVYHELGHCSLNIRHYDASIDIMNPSISDDVTNLFDFYRAQMRLNYALGRYMK